MILHSQRPGRKSTTTRKALVHVADGTITEQTSVTRKPIYRARILPTHAVVAVVPITQAVTAFTLGTFMDSGFKRSDEMEFDVPKNESNELCVFFVPFLCAKTRGRFNMASTCRDTLRQRIKPRVFVVDGLIAAGKSTLILALAEKLNREGVRCVAVLEPVAQWRERGILQKFYEDPVGLAYTFQTYTFVTRIRAVRDAWEKNKDADVFLLERSVFTDIHCFMRLQAAAVGEQTMAMYNDWVHLHLLLMPVDLSQATYVFLKPDVGQCMKRLVRRGRAEEVIGDPQETKGDRVVAKSTDKTTTVASPCLSCGGQHSASTTVASPVHASGGVSVEYQQQLQRAHEALLQGWHVEEFPFPQGRPFPLSSVVVLDRELSHANFSPDASAKERDRALDAILKRLFSTDSGDIDLTSEWCILT